MGIVAAVNKKTSKTAVLISNFKDESSRYTLDMKHLTYKKQIVCSEYVIDDNRNLDLDREQTLSSDDFRVVVELLQETVRLVVFSRQGQSQ